MEFDFYSDEPPRYFSRPADEFDGYDPQKNREKELEDQQANNKPNRRKRI